MFKKCKRFLSTSIICLTLFTGVSAPALANTGKE